ncbi:MAG: glycosyltransferase [Dehalococcoidia bacterium]|nr:glycosyltransferase [Dehalococcoidia bacterium]MDW8119900.1 glycosyltransferase [Chloroflexota bacterium]
MRILYTGPFRPGSLTEARRRALLDLGHQVVGLDQAIYFDKGHPLLRKAQNHALIGPGIWAYNRDLLRLARETKPELIYVDMGISLWPKTIRALRATGAKVVHYTSEFFGYRRYLYRHFFPAVPFYHAHVITNRLVIPELEKRGAQKIVITEFGYDPSLHRPPNLTSEERQRYGSDVVFVGHWEPHYEKMLSALHQAGVAVRVWGPGWRRAHSFPRGVLGPPVYGEEYVKVLGASKICLGLLSKWNHNQSASRTFEIPAVGAFLLAERTEDHLRYFAEDKEAVFFSSAEELVEKARYYLTHEEERLRIARAGRERCLRSPYTHTDRMRAVLEALG